MPCEERFLSLNDLIDTKVSWKINLSVGERDDRAIGASHDTVRDKSVSGMENERTASTYPLEGENPIASWKVRRRASWAWNG